MPLAIEDKQQVISEHRTSDKDTGSPEVQIAILTARIKQVADHLESNKHDHHSRRGLLSMVSRRNRLLRYLQRKDRDSYQKLIKNLGLRK
ncbi:MAG: 30S ribosomal protein S15 [Phycisphaeraceae bacterium]|nr:30S ribosomal protein S15 [Phycisphaeraceae bacterium]